MKKVLALVLAAMLLLGCVGGIASAEEGKIKLVVWSFTNELQGMIEKYYLPDHPELEIEFQIYPTDGNAYTTKVDNLLGSNAASDEAPDIFTLEAAFVKHYVEMDWTADLKEIGFTGPVAATELWTGKTLNLSEPVLRQSVKCHDCAVFRISPAR